MMESPSSLPRITKRELAKVGVHLVHEDNTRDWMRRGWLELDLYLWNQQRFAEYDLYKRIQEERKGMGVPKRIFEEDGA